MNPDEYLKELKSALDEYRFSDTDELNNKIDPYDFKDEDAKNALGLLRKKRLFPAIEKAASLFMNSGLDSPVLRRQYAQALLDQDRVPQAVTVLNRMMSSTDKNPEERSEVKGLLGRAFKQLYVNEEGRENLQKAIDSYSSGWTDRQGDHRWHGINLVALLNRAQIDGVDPKITIDQNEIARDILTEIHSLGEDLNVWDYGTATEAAIALGDENAALRWVKKYVLHPGADAFELGSTLRQFKEVWRLADTNIGKKLLPVMEFALLNHEGGELQVAQTALSDTGGFEAVFGNESHTNIQWFESMLERCKSVARVSNTATGENVGTGFIMKGAELCNAWGEEPVFVTNAHVISNDPADAAPLMIEDGSAEFTRLANRPKYQLGALLFTSPKIELDVSVFRINSSDDILPLKSTRYSPLVPKGDAAPQRIYVVGHPNGGEMTVTLYDNSLEGYVDNRYVHYRSPTEGGHSGSPVFTREWKLFAIHHRAIKEKQVNEGILMQAIREKAGS